jgi:superfamily II DNA/RNA helicase
MISYIYYSYTKEICRVLDLIKRRKINVRNVKIFVLDEADNMLDQQGLGDQSIRVKQYVHYPLNISIEIKI